MFTRMREGKPPWLIVLLAAADRQCLAASSVLGGTISAQRPVVARRGINGFQFPQIQGNDKLKGIHAA